MSMVHRHREWLAAGILATGLALASGCSDDGSLGFDYDFAGGPSGWVAGFHARERNQNTSGNRQCFERPT